jgi:hypothetical protein
VCILDDMLQALCYKAFNHQQLLVVDLIVYRSLYPRKSTQLLKIPIIKASEP